MLTPYIPCTDCTHKDKCSKCAYTNLKTNYERALNKIRELSAELGKPITIIVP